MGWASGSRLASKLIEAAKDTISDEEERVNFYDAMVDAFEDADCDTLDECLGDDPVFDAYWKTKYTDLDWDE
jgi:hypothetical protein